MGLDDDIKHNAEDMKGKVKEKVGDATDNERLQAE
ncbi:MAG: CsbD family protein, partial [Microbacterium sp.]